MICEDQKGNMRQTWFALVVGGWVLAIAPSAAQVRAIDAERMLADRFGFTPEEVARARGGDAVAKTLKTNDAVDLAVVAAVKVGSTPDRLANWFNDIASFRQAAQLGLARRVGDPPQTSDFADLSLDADEVTAIKGCRPGKCDLLLGDKAIARFQADVNWSAPDSGPRASAVMRELLTEYGQAYLKGGDQALGVLHHEKSPKVLADEFHQVLWQAKALYDVAPDLAAYLEGFPAAKLAGAQSFLYWAKNTVGSDASISMHQLVIYRAPGGDVFVTDKQLYASRYVDSMLTVILLGSAPDGKGFYVIAGARARSSMLGSLGARVMRGKVEQAVREQTQTYLAWIRSCLAL
jgi:hypothetical protein